MKKGFFLSTIALLSLSALAACGSGGGGGTTSGGGASASTGPLNIGAVKVWCDKAIKGITESRLNAFKTEHPDYTVEFTIEEVGEGDAATQMITDPEAGADLFFFAQDQLTRLISAGAVDELAKTASDTVKAWNDEGSVKAATFNEKVYAYPATSDNGYFMYYDKSVLGNTDMTDFEAIAAKVKAAGKTIYYNYGSAWYNAAFFLAGGAKCTYTVDGDGNYTAVTDNYDSDGGKAAAQALHNLIKDKGVFVDDSKASGFNSGAAVVISGTWDAATAREALGDNLGATMLPKVKINNVATQLSSFAGFKLLGAKPQTVRDRVIGVREIALALTNEAAQKERFEQNNWGPSNKNVQNLDAVKNDPVLNAIFSQNAVAYPQGQYPQAWWTLAGALGTGLAEENANVDSLIAAYKAGLPGTLS